MMHHRRILAFVLMVLFLAAGNAVAKHAEPFQTKLDNGLTVIIEEEHSAPVVSVQMWVNVGSADEAPHESGISHVFEHMLFKGTEKRKVGQIATIIETVGGDINAYTSFDHTVYHLNVPSRYFSTGLDIIGDAIQRSSFDPEELKKELEVVLEEIRMNEDNPGRKLYKSLLETAYTTHPYKRPVIGTEKSVKSFTREQIISFFRKWYIPNNMTLVITGDVDRNKALDAVKKEFRDFQKRDNPHRKRPVEPPQDGLKAAILSQQVTEAHLGMGFHIPELMDQDIYAIDVLSIVLSGGETSRLYKELKIKSETVHSISAYPMALKDPGLFLVTASLDAKNIGGAVAGSMREIRKLVVEGPNHEELQKAKLNLESDFIYSRETMDGIASKLGYYQANFGDIGYEKKYIDGIRKVTPDDIKRVARKYLIDGKMSVVALLPAAQKDSLSRDALLTQAKAAAEGAQKESEAKKEAAPRISRVKLENGITLIVKEVDANPTVAFYAAFPGGLRHEDASNNGIGSFAANMLTRGTVKRTREELAKETEEMAGGVGGFSGWNSIGVSGKFLSMHFDKGLGILADVILNPVFPEDEIEKLRKDQITAIKRQEDYMPGYTFKLLYRELFKDHPYGMPVIGSVETVSSFTKKDLQEHYQKFFVPERMVLVIAGDIKKEYAVEKVKSLFGDFKRPSAPLPAPPVEARQTVVRKTGDIKEKAQTNIGIGFLGTTITDAERYPLHVAAEVLSGQGGRLFIELRDKKSLAYSVSAILRDGADPGIFGVYIASAPEKKDEAIEGIMSELENIRQEKVSENELRRAKSSIIGGYEIGLQDVSSQASDIANNELYGLGYMFNKEFPEKIEAVTANDVLEIARKYINLDAYTISIVGPNGNPKEAK